MSKFFSKKLFAIAFFLSLTTAVLQFASQRLSWQRMDGQYPIRHMELGAMMTSEISKGMPIVMSEPDVYWSNDALEVEQRLYATSSYSQLVVRDVSGYTERLRTSILAQDGRVLSSSIEKYGRYKVGSISARVPSERASAILATIKEGVVTVVSERTSTQDETGQYVGITDKIAVLKEEILYIEETLADTESGPVSAAERRGLERQLQSLQTQITNLEASQNVVADEVRYARIDVNVSDGARYFDPTAQPTPWELVQMGWGMIALLWHFVWSVAILTVLYMFVWLPVTFVFSLAWTALQKKQS